MPAALFLSANLSQRGCGGNGVLDAGLRLPDAGGRPHEQRVEEPILVDDELVPGSQPGRPTSLTSRSWSISFALVGLEVRVCAAEAIDTGGARKAANFIGTVAAGLEKKVY
jgi:hypothetical protein